MTMQTPFRHFFHPPNIAHEGKELCDHIGRRLATLCWGWGGERGRKEGRVRVQNPMKKKVRGRDKEGKKKGLGGWG